MNKASSLHAADLTEVEAIHAFWFGEPARDPAQLLSKFARWYQGGAAVDREIRARFATTLERALAGALTAWAAEPRSRLALIVLLDQFTRNLHRDTPRAYAGDAAARELALRTIDRPEFLAFSLEERLFCIMPLVHAESLALHDRAVELARSMALDAPPELRGPWQFGAERTAHYREIIERFGRFPHRNGVLGRRSTPEQLAFLAEEAKEPPPLAAAGAPASPAS